MQYKTENPLHLLITIHTRDLLYSSHILCQTDLSITPYYFYFAV